MPFIKEDQILQDITTEGPERTAVVAEQEEPTVSETVGAAFQTENVLGSYLANVGNDTEDSTFDGTFDPMDHIQSYEGYARDFAYTNNLDEVNLVKQQIDLEVENDKLLAESGALGTAAVLGAAILDPINLIPIGGAAYKTYRTGGSVLQGAMATAGATALATTAAEASLHHTQLTRTYGESAVDIGASAFLGGVLGGYIRFANNKAITKMEKDLNVPNVDEPDVLGTSEVIIPGLDSAGAASFESLSKNQESLANALGVDKVDAKLMGFTSPIARTMVSDSLVVRRVAQSLAETPQKLNKNSEGIASDVAVETILKQYDKNYYDVVNDLDDNFVKYRTGAERKFGGNVVTAAKDFMGEAKRTQKMTRAQFNEEVGKAMSMGDRHEVPEVAAAAKAFRAKIYNPLLEEAKKVGLFNEKVGEEVVGAESFFNRVYSREKIIANRPDFEKRVFDWISRKEVELKAKLQTELDELKASKAPDKARIRELEEDLKFIKNEDELRARSTEITDRVINTPEGRVPYESHFDGTFSGMSKEDSMKRGSQLRRVFDIPDEQIMDFLDRDVERISRMYQKTMATDIKLKERFGSVDMEDQIRQINEDYAKIIKDIKDPKLLTKVQKRKDSDIQDLMAMRDRLRGTYGLAKDPHHTMIRTGRQFRAWNFATLMGGVVVSSIPDISKIVGVNGMMPALRDGLVPMIGRVIRLGKESKGNKKLKEELRAVGIGLDSVLSTRLSAMADLNLEYAPTTKFERATDSITNAFGAASLMNHWNDSLKNATGRIVVNRMYSDLSKVANGKAGKKEIERLAFGGISKREARAVYEQIRKHGEKVDGIRIPNTGNWDQSAIDNGLVTKFRAAIAKEVDRAIVTPGVGDRPLWLSTDLGKTIGQFQSFMFSSMQRTLIPMLQERDLKTLQQLITGVGLGMLVYYLKTDPEDLSENPEDWVVEGLDRSGFLAWIMNANNTVEKLSGGRLGVSGILGKKPMSRYQARNGVDALLGPSLGKVKSVADVSRNAMQEEWSEQDTRALRRLVPFQNMFYLRNLFDKLEEGTNETFGIRER